MFGSWYTQPIIQRAFDEILGRRGLGVVVTALFGRTRGLPVGEVKAYAILQEESNMPYRFLGQVRIRAGVGTALE